MNLLELGLLALVEGIADIFPIDASTHSLIVARLLQVRANPLMPALHLGVALALAVYFWRDMTLIASGLWKLRKARIEAGTRLLAKVLAAALPFILVYAGVGGLSLPDIGSVLWIGLVTIVFGLIMIFADQLSLTVKRIEHIGGLTCLAIGVAQALALIHGIGRVPAGMLLARLFGMERSAAYRFVLLSSLPILLAEVACGALRDDHSPGLSDLLGAALSFAAALIALAVGFAVMRRSGLMIFGIYRLIFGAALVGLSLL